MRSSSAGLLFGIEVLDFCGAAQALARRLDSAGRLRATMGVRRSGTNADDRLPIASLGRV
jgi:hypothetical protein